MLIVLLLLPFCACHAESLDLSQLSNVELRALAVEINGAIMENTANYNDEILAFFMENMLDLGHELEIIETFENTDNEIFTYFSVDDLPPNGRGREYEFTRWPWNCISFE